MVQASSHPVGTSLGEANPKKQLNFQQRRKQISTTNACTYRHPTAAQPPNEPLSIKSQPECSENPNPRHIDLASIARAPAPLTTKVRTHHLAFIHLPPKLCCTTQLNVMVTNHSFRLTMKQQQPLLVIEHLLLLVKPGGLETSVASSHPNQLKPCGGLGTSVVSSPQYHVSTSRVSQL